MNNGLKIQRCNFLPEGEMTIIKDTNTLIHNIVDSELKQKDKEIERLKVREEEITQKYLSATKYASEKEDENIRLNNIINELEKDINNQLTMTRKLDKYNNGFFNAVLHFYNKLNALKEGE